MNATKEQALKKMTAAGYTAEVTKAGLDVCGKDWSVHYSDRGQDHDVHTGSVPLEVEELAVWDDTTKREEALHENTLQN